MTSTFGDYDRDTENQNILTNPPAAVGNPGAGTVADDLASLFQDSDGDHYVTFKATAPNGSVLALEFDTNLEPEEWTRYQKLASGNRASRRGSTTGSDGKPWLSAAAMVAEKSTKITNLATGKVYTDAEGDPLTLRSEEWLALAERPGDPIAAALKFFGFTQVVTLGNGYVEATGLDDEVERIDPTHA